MFTVLVKFIAHVNESDYPHLYKSQKSMSLSWLTCKYNMCYIQTSVTAQLYDNSMMLDKETVESKKEKEE